MHIKSRLSLYHGIDKLGLTNLISNIGFASVGTIWALYLESILHNASYVGFVNSFLIVIGILAYFLIIPLMQEKNKIKLYVSALFLYTLSYFLFTELSGLYAVIILGMIVAVAGSLRITSFGIIVRDKTRDGCVAKNKGLIYTSLNLAWMIGPLIAGFIAEKYGINKVFFFAAIVVFLSLILFEIFKIKDSRKDKKVDENGFKVFVDFFKSKERVKSYILAGGGNFWWALIYTYIPIYIIQNGLDDIIVGYFLFAIVVPLILSEYLWGKLAGKIGFKKMFIIGFLSLGIISIVCFFISNIYFLLGVLILASFAVAMIEPTTEAYFLDIISENQRDKYYGPFTTSIDATSLIALMAGAVTLLFLPLKFVFLVFGGVMLIFVLISFSIRDFFENKKCQ